MRGSIRIVRLLGIPVFANVSLLLTLAIVTGLLALSLYPAAIPDASAYKDNQLVHWLMALVSAIAFFSSILVHELAHSVVARRQGLDVERITLFIFGGVSQIAGEPRRPLNEFVMAIVGPLASLALGGILFGLWVLGGSSDSDPFWIVIQWLLFMNLVVGIFNLVPAFPMDGGRIFRSGLWGLSGDFLSATRWASFLGRAFGYGMMFVGGLAIFGRIGFLGSWESGIWLAILGIYLESAARQSWLQARALDTLSSYRAADLMSADLKTAAGSDPWRNLLGRADGRFIFFVADAEDAVVGVLTEKEAAAAGLDPGVGTTVADLMVRTADAKVAAPDDDAAKLLQKMEEGSVWHLPVVSEGRVVGVVSKENLLRLLSRNLLPRRALPADARGR